MALGSTPLDAEHFVAETQSLRDLTRRLAALRTRQARLASCFQNACSASQGDPLSPGDVRLAHRLAALLTRVERRQDGMIAEVEALVAKLADER